MTEPEPQRTEPQASLDQGLRAAFAGHRTRRPEPPSVLQQLESRAGTSLGLHLPEPPQEQESVLRIPGADAAESRLGTTRYRIHGEIARGGVGVVYQGRDVDLGRDVAVKVLHEGLARRPDILQRFVEEAQIGSQLQHPGIVPVYEVGIQADERPFFAMKLIKGETLAAWLERRRDLSEERRKLLAIFQQVCQTVAYAHARKVAHRDLKPANIMVGAFGEVQVVDWGVAKVLRAGVDGGRPPDPRAPDPSVIETVRSKDVGSQSLVGSVMGTPAYMPPEQAQGDVEHMDERSDVFSLGAILCEILTGRPPYTRDDDPDGDVLAAAARCNTAPALARLADCGADRDLAELVRQCLSASQQARPKNARVLADAIQGHVAAVEERARQARLAAARAGVAAREARRLRRLTLAVSVAVLAAMGVAGTAWYRMERSAEARLQEVRARIAVALRQAVEFEGRAAGMAPAAAMPLWEQALDAARTASAAAAEAADADTTQPPRVAIARIQAGRTAAQQAADRIALHASLADALTEARIPLAVEVPAHRSVESARDVEQEYRRVFEEHGIDIAGSTVDRLVARLAGDRAVAFAAVLDHWSHLQRLIGRIEKRTPQLLAKILAVARGLRPGDPLRDRLHALLARDQIDDAHLTELAGIEISDEMSAASLCLMAAMLERGAAPHRQAAVAVYRRCQQLHPGDFATHLHLGLALARLQPAEARACFVAALARQPRSARLMFRIFATCQRQRDGAGMTAWAARVAAADPGSALAASARAILLWKHAGDIPAAIDVLRAALDRDLDNPRLHGCLGAALLDLPGGRGLSAARPHLERAVQLAPHSAELRVTLGTLYTRAGELDLGLRCYQDAVTVDPASAAAHFQLGRAALRRGDLAKARQSLDRVLALEPDHAEARKLLDTLPDRSSHR